MVSVTEEARPSGIPVLGRVPWASHFCQFYQSKQHLVDVLVPYFRAGLEGNEFCVWVTSEALTTQEARASLADQVPGLDELEARGQMEIFPYTDWYLAGGHFDMDRILQGWSAKYRQGLERGFDGLRVSGNTAWLEGSHWDSFSEYESRIDAAIEGQNILVLCTYALDRCGPYELLDVVRNHQFALVRGQRGWELIQSTELRRARELQQQSEARYRDLFNAMGEGFAVHEIVCDPTGRPVDYRFLDVNPAFERLTGLRREDVVGRTLSQVLPGAEPVWVDTYGRVALTGQPAHLEQFSQELCRWYEVYAYCPSPGRFATLFLDVTRARRAQEQQRRGAEDLARSNRELEQFAYIVSHDLQEPLRGVTGFLSLLQSRHAPRLAEEARGYIQWAVESAAHMSRLIEDLLSYSRLHTSEQQLSPADLNAALERALANCAAALAESGAQVTSDRLPTVTGNATQLTQLLQNLVGNAAKFRRPDVAPRVHVSAGEADGEWVVSVQDNGIGIAPDQAERIFQVFQRLHTRRAYPGTGIGLAICKKIVERHGGRIWVESTPGEGSRFRFALPCARGQA
ncbi:MAG: MEDS domain-containing protein [Candidatus Latescibacterota bacterium]